MVSLLLLLSSCDGLGHTFSFDDQEGDEEKPVNYPARIVPEADEAQEAAPVRLPAGDLIVRQCFGGTREEARRSPTSTPTGGSGSWSRSAGNAPPPPVTTPMPAPSLPTTAGQAPSGIASAQPTAPSAEIISGGRSSAGAGDSSVAQGKKADAPRARAEAAPLDDLGATAGSAATTSASTEADKGGALGTRSMTKPKASEPAAPTKQLAKDSTGDGGEGEAAGRWVGPTVPEPTMDWGATVYLSNDDSMSLASAQRLLWAVQKRGPVKTSEVRPHEFLNYFSFDTTPVQGRDLFSVNGSAAQTGPDTLTVAMAVRGVVPKRKPLDLTLVLDRSGSMSAEGRMEYLKRGLTRMTDNLQRGDRVDFVLFDDQVCTPLENFVVGRDDMSVLNGVINQLAPRGSTDLDAGLHEGYRIANAHADTAGRNRRMLLISDALLNTGNIDPDTVSEVARSYDAANVRLTAVGVGRDFNDKVLDMLSEKGKGAYVYLGSEAVVDRVFGVGFQSLTQTIAHDVRFALDLPPSLAMERFYGEESSTNPEDVMPINYFGGTTQLFLQDLKIRGSRPTASDPVTLTVSYTDADTRTPETQSWTTTVGALLDADPRNVNKGRALMAWTDLILARSMGGNPCGASFSTWQERVATLGADAEIGWLDGLTSPLCGARPVEPPIAVSGVTYRVKVDSDLPIAEVTMRCAGRESREQLTGSDTVASFSVQPGSCVLTLQGNVPMQTTVKVPETGADVRCLVRGGRMSCS